MSNLSASLEDYLEVICNLLETSDCVKAVEISRKLNISRASVSEALNKLVEKGLIIYEGHKGITITESGLLRAKEVISKHNTLTSFFENVLCLNKEESEDNACKIEHVISNEFFDRLKKLTNKELGLFNIPSDIFVLLNVMDIDKTAKLYVSEMDFEEDLRQLINRKFALI